MYIVVEKGMVWVMVVAVAGASAEPASPSVGTATTEAKAVSAAREISPRPGQRPR